MLTSLYPYAITIGAVLGMMAIWVVVQKAWKQTFPDVGGDVDALATRSGCGGCSHESHCDIQSGGRDENENCDLDSHIVRDTV